MITIKNKTELDIMKKAGWILALAHEEVRKNAKPGITTLELDSIAEKVIRSQGAIPSFKGYPGVSGAIDFPSSICASINEEVVHGIPNNRILKDGDILSVDIGACYNGYHGDAARTIPIGNVSKEASDLIRVTEESFSRGIEKAVCGNRIIDIAGSIEDYVVKRGYSVVRDYVGHGIGTKMHEDPAVPNYRGRFRGPRLEVGMTLAVEPMVNVGTYKVKVLGNKWTVVTADGKLSAHYENTIAITEKEPIVLTML